MVKDPVCGMDVDGTKAKHSSTVSNKTYYFCSAACKSRFDRLKQIPSQAVSEDVHAGHRGEATLEGKNQGVNRYVCPMHPHITSDHPGRCPECGMKLESPPGSGHGPHDESHYAVGDFKRRFWVSAGHNSALLLFFPLISEGVWAPRFVFFLGRLFYPFFF